LGNPVDRRADIFSAGIMLHLMTSGQHPFKNHRSVGVLHSITSGDPAARPSLLKPGYSRTLEAVVMRALEKNRDQRWASADEMRLALQKAVPDAFAVGIDADVESFMTATCGARAAAKREAVRRVEQQRDTRMAAVRSLATAGATAQSASSLRAVSVDTSVTDEQESSRLSFAPTLQPPPEPSVAPTKHRRPWVMGAFIGFGLVGAALSLVLRLQTADHASHVAGSGFTQLAPTSTARARLEPTPVVDPASSASATNVAVAPPRVPSSSVAAQPKAPKGRIKVRPMT
jgi:eukaryotic-like serine/threonine-protein kinase